MLEPIYDLFEFDPPPSVSMQAGYGSSGRDN